MHFWYNLLNFWYNFLNFWYFFFLSFLYFFLNFWFGYDDWLLKIMLARLRFFFLLMV